jgi:TOTE conflict system primase-like protein
MKTIEEHFADPSSLRNPDDRRIYALLVQAGWLTPPEQLELRDGSILLETPLVKRMHRQAATKKRRVKHREMIEPQATISATVNIAGIVSVNSAEQQPCEAPRLPAKITRQPPVTIDTFMTKKQFVLLAMHMLNRNPMSHFLSVWRDEKDGSAHFAKAKSHRRADATAAWAYDSVTGKAQRKTSIGVYPKNRDNQSNWSAIDIDNHDGTNELAKELAEHAFSLCLHYRDRTVILSDSGRGYHIFVLSQEPRPVSEWVGMLTDVAVGAGLPIKDGVCEIFPSEKTLNQESGRAIRLPGTINPTTGQPELIMADTIMPLIQRLENRQNTQNSFSLRSKTDLPRQLLRDKRSRKLLLSAGPSSSFASGTTKELIEKILTKFAIKTKSTRSETLVRITGELLHKFGQGLSERIIRWHYERYQENITTPLADHLKEFNAAWGRFLKRDIERLSPQERSIFEQLRSEPLREAFLLLRSFSSHASRSDFPVAQLSLADRLSISQRGASYVIARLAELGAIEKTANSVTNSKVARYKWTCQ